MTTADLLQIGLLEHQATFISLLCYSFFVSSLTLLGVFAFGGSFGALNLGMGWLAFLAEHESSMG